MKITASAPGKLVLFGDHAAVYGKPCLVTAVDLRFSTTVEPLDEPVVEISTPQLREQGETYRVQRDAVSARNRRETAFVEAALRQLIDRYKVTSGFHVDTEGPQVTFGLGSSSAIAAATLVAAAQQLKLEIDKREIFDLVYAAVLDVQGTGSGVDVAAAVYGGTVYYVNRGDMIERLPDSHLPIVIGYSGSKVSTTNLIGDVARLRDRQPDFMHTLLHMLGDMSVQARDHILHENWQAFGDLMNIHQGILDGFGVNTLQLARLIFAAREAGATGAKISGAGGGDCMFALAVESTRSSVTEAIQQADGTPVDIATGADGVRLETTSHKA
ncbi:MAG: mevalonate kinase [Anaerolineaceae bacterium]|nr:mevalonate kinase [Anaerolineaceae bacterium]